jgi:uncharacterized membrane protein YedE/YeeE
MAPAFLGRPGRRPGKPRICEETGMNFSSFASAYSAFLWATFAIALVMGAVANKTNFCTMGAVSDLVNIGDKGRLRAWLLAIALAILGVTIMQATGKASFDSTFPPYRASSLIWFENVLGGFMFGIGMTLGSGCGNKTLVRAGGGNIKSVMVFAIIALIAYFMVNPFPGTDKTLYSELFLGWIKVFAVQLPVTQDVGALISRENPATARLWAGIIVASAVLIYVLKSADFRKSFDNVLGGLVVGLAVIAGWYISSGIFTVTADGEKYTILSYVQNWAFLTDRPGKPIEATMNLQSYTFINPMGQALGYASSGFAKSLLSFGVVTVAGIVLGSFLWSLISKSFRIEWFASFSDFVNHFIGGILMGFGGVLGLGCTIGQGITGVSTLALGSILTLVSIVFGSALTMKVQYYLLDEQGFLRAVRLGLADMKLMPKPKAA